MGYIKWLGHSAFEILLDNKILYIDPWISNPKSPIKLQDISKADYIFITHDHGDHFGESVEIAKKTNATIVGIYEIANKAGQLGAKKTIGGNIGGPIFLEENLITYLVPALHSSLTGTPTGIIIRGSEKTIYHAGDTGVFGDMTIIHELYKPDIALIPIGGHYTMGPFEAAKAVELLKPEIVIPMHYGTFPVLSGTPEQLKKFIEERGIDVKIVVLKPGESYNF